MIRDLVKKIIPFRYHEAFSGISRKLSIRFWKKVSYSQCGEDLILDFLIQEILKIKDVTYLDLGAHHPFFMSNTYFFYKKGFSGVLVEPDPVLCKTLRKRWKDEVVNAGVGVTNQKEADFYIMNKPELNSFSKDWVEQVKSYATLERVVKIPLVTINDLIKDYCKKCPTFVSLDVEGLDLDIVRTFDFKVWRPPVFCIETIVNGSEQKITEINNIMEKNNYMIYADTRINTIYADKSLMEVWRQS